MNKAKNIPDFILEQYMLNELDLDKKREVEIMIEGSSELKEQIERMKTDNDLILEKYPSHKMSTIIKEKVKEEKKVKLTIFFFKPQYSLLLVLPLIVFFSYQFLEEPIKIIKVPKEHINIKGEYGIKVARLAGKEINMLENGNTAKEGDLIQLKYHIPTGKFGILLSLDGRGEITYHLLQNQNGSTDLNGEKKLTLQNSYELDDAPNFERFFMVVSESELSIEEISNKVRKLKNPKTDKLKLKSEVQQWSFLLNKID